jgi:nitrate/nitrite transport system ATP-binding protein
MNKPIKTQTSRVQRHLELSDVGIDFPTPKGPFTALKNVSLKISKGEFISLIGHSGCGKSTVLNIVAGLYQATTAHNRIRSPRLVASGR